MGDGKLGDVCRLSVVQWYCGRTVGESELESELELELELRLAAERLLQYQATRMRGSGCGGDDMASLQYFDLSRAV